MSHLLRGTRSKLNNLLFRLAAAKAGLGLARVSTSIPE